MGAVVDFSVLNTLIFLAGWSDDAGKLYANVVSTGAAILSNFIWNRLWTFPGARKRGKGKQLAQFATVAVTGLVLNTAIFYLSNRFVYELFVSETLAIQFAKMTAIGLVLFWNFSLNRLWTYRGL